MADFANGGICLSPKIRHFRGFTVHWLIWFATQTISNFRTTLILLPIFLLTSLGAALAYFIKRKILRSQDQVIPINLEVDRVSIYNNASANKPLVGLVPIIVFGNLIVLSFLPSLFINEEVLKIHPWLVLLKELPVWFLWGILIPCIFYVINKEARKYVIELFKDVIGL